MGATIALTPPGPDQVNHDHGNPAAGTRELLALWQNWGKLFTPLNQGAARYVKKKVAPDATHLVFVRLNKGDVS